MHPNPRAAGIGRKKGTPNKVKSDARQALGFLLENNLDRIQGWIDETANGVFDEEGKVLVKPDPAGAFDMLMKLCEYVLPKLARIDVDVSADVGVKTFRVLRVKAESTAPPPLY